jgi:iron complex outermembrane receptor protein
VRALVRACGALLVCGALLSIAQTLPTHRKETIVITGAFEPVPLEEADRPITTLPVRPFAPLFTALDDILHLEPSVDLRQRAPGAVQSGASIRGGTFGQTLVLLNGFRLNDVQSANHNMDVPLPIDAISQVEVLRGSGSTLYGSDAVAGVVNFLAQPPQASEFRLRAGIGNFGVNQQRGVLSHFGGRWSEQLTFSRDFSSGFRENRDYRNLSLASVTRVGRAEIVLAHNDRPFGADQFYGNFNSWERTRTWFAGARQKFGNTEASFAFRRHTDLFVLYRDQPQVFTNRHAVEGYQGALRRVERVGDNTRLHFGAEAYRDAIDSTNLGSHRRGRQALYAAWDVRALRRFSFNLGLRGEIYRNVQHQLSPTASMGVWLSPHWKLRGSAGRAFRLPSYTDLYYHDPANLGSPDLRPESAWSYDGGVDWNAGVLRAEATVFHRRERDGIDYVRRSVTEIWRAANFRRLNFTGVEAAFAAAARREHRIELRYTGLRGVQAAAGELLTKYTFNYPIHSTMASWTGPLPYGWIGRTRMGVLKRYARSPYAVWDAAISLGKGRVRPYVAGNNLTAAMYEEIFGVPMPGRSVLAGIEVKVR